ncbi:hypothetical protein AgCh_015449 [Apium graveolens]
MDQKMEKHFVLVHGACHGAWCWYKVAMLLRSAGHKVTVLDLAASGLNAKKVQEVKSFSVYLEPLMEFMASLLAEEKVVLVGHSLGGVALSVAMERFPEKVSVAVFATAYMLNPDLDVLTVSEKVEKNIGSFMDSQDLTLASMLVRPHPLKINYDTISLEETKVTKERFGSVRRVYVIADQDIIHPEEFQRWMIELNPPDEVRVITGSDHMIMICKPQELCICLEEVSLQYN